MPNSVAVIVRVLARRIVPLVTKNHAISFWINWKTCITIHSMIVNTMDEIRLSKYANSVGELLLCSEAHKVNISFHCPVSFLLD